jgi:hypothetical protein
MACAIRGAIIGVSARFRMPIKVVKCQTVSAWRLYGYLLCDNFEPAKVQSVRGRCNFVCACLGTPSLMDNGVCRLTLNELCVTGRILKLDFQLL